jgi:uncharacterized membrane protein YqjE
MSDQTEPKSIPTLLGDAVSQFSKLFQNEVELARAELGEKAQQIAKAVIFFAGCAALVMPALVMALLALASVLVANDWSQPVAYLISAAVGALLAAVLFVVGMRILDSRHLGHSETLHQLQKDKEAIKGFVR